METIQSVVKWADETFGKTSPLEAMERARLEMYELERKWEETDLPYNLIAEEAADVIITLYRFLALTDPEAIEKKMAINRSRKWVVTGQGVGQHLEERETNP